MMRREHFMTKVKVLLTIATASLLGTSGLASTPAAWKQLDRRIARACIASSGLAQAKIVADKASFSDRVPIEIRIVEGYNSGSVIDVKLCAYDRHTGKAATTDGAGRLGVNRN